jgi:hypothetical protein
MSLMTIIDGLVKNPYSEFYESMDEYELAAWKMLCEQSIRAVGLTRDKVLRLGAINETLKLSQREEPRADALGGAQHGPGRAIWH